MVRAIAMRHDKDPGEVIAEQVAPYIHGLEVAAYHVLVGVYVRPNVTAGGIHLTDTHGPRVEDVWQGKVGLILKIGPHCFEAGEAKRFAKVPQVGHWAVFNVGDTFAFQLGHGEGTRCRMVFQEDIKLLTENPDYIY